MLMVYFVGIIYYLETMLRIAVSGKILTIGMIYALCFAVPVGLLCGIITGLFKEKTQRRVAQVITGIICTIFASQFIYFKIFRVFYSLYSAGNAGQIFQFWEIIYIKVRNNFLVVCLMYLPLGLLFLKIKGAFIIKPLKKMKLAQFIQMVVGAVMVQVLTVGSLYLGSKEPYTPYDLYFKHVYPIISAEKLGLVTTLRLDAERTFLNWTPNLDSDMQQSVMITQLSGEELEKQSDLVEALSTQVDSSEESDGKNKEYNVLPIDFERIKELAADQKDADDIKDACDYFEKVQPTAKNSYTGKYKGYNLICITAESLSPYAIRKDLTPTLYKLAHEGYQFTNFYTPLWELSTSDGEYAICTGQIPKSGVWSMAGSSKNAMPFVLGNQLKAKGYKTMAFHDHEYDYYDRQLSHPNMGYEYKALGNGLEVEKTWPESDLEMMQKTVSQYDKHEPFHTYYMTVSGHMNYTFRENDMAKKNRAVVENLDLTEREQGYLAAQVELDRAIENLLEQLKAAGVLDHTLIMITPDHYPYGLDNQELSDLAGKKIEENFETYKSTMILYNPKMQPTIIDKPCSSLDILPTMSNLMGLDYDSRLFVGRDIFSDAEPLVMFYNRSFITDKGMYNALTREFLTYPSIKVTEDFVKQQVKAVDAKFFYSAKILETDYYKYVLEALK